MSVYERPNSPYWWMHVEHAPRGQQRRSTKILKGTTLDERRKSRHAADRVYYTAAGSAGEIAQGLAPRQTAPTFNEFADWWVEHKLPLRRAKEREAEILVRLRRDFGKRRLTQITKEAVDEWRTKRRTTPTVIEGFGQRRGGTDPLWYRIHRWLKAQGPTALAAITAEFSLSPRSALRSFVKGNTAQHFERVSRGVWAAVGTPDRSGRRTFLPPSARTVNRETDVLQAILKAAVPKHFDVSPLAGLARLRAISPARRIASEEEERKVLAALSPVDRAIYLLGRDALLRMIDAINLRRSDDLGKTLRLRDSKNGQQHTPIVTARLRDALDAVPVDSEDRAYYFPSRRKARTERDRRRGMAQALERACAKAGVPYGRAVHGLTFHWGTRRTGATRMIRKLGAKGIGAVQKLGNWKDPNVLIGIYQEVDEAEMLAAAEAAVPKLRRVK